MRLYPRFVDEIDRGETDAARFGAKGASLIDLHRRGFDVPPAFLLEVAQCRALAQQPEAIDAASETLSEALRELEKRGARALGRPAERILFALRSSSVEPAPGLLPTYLPLGVDARYLESCSDSAQHSPSQRAIAFAIVDLLAGELLPSAGAPLLPRLELPPENVPGLHEVRAHFQTLERFAKEHLGIASGLPREVQLRLAMRALFKAWSAHPDQASGVVVQVVVACDVEQSVVGVALSRDPREGRQHIRGEYLRDALGLMLSSGRASACVLGKHETLPGREHEALESWAPALYRRVQEACDRVERDTGMPQTLEFAAEGERLFLLQYRPLAASAQALARFASEALEGESASLSVALSRFPALRARELLRFEVPREGAPDALTQGLPACPGAVVGLACFTEADVSACLAQGQSPILVIQHASAEDGLLLRRVAAVITAQGGTTSHAAIMARSLGVICIVSCEGMRVDARAARASIGAGRAAPSASTPSIERLSRLTVDAWTGKVYEGDVGLCVRSTSEAFDRLLAACPLAWPRLAAPASTFAQLKALLSLGAEGVVCEAEMWLQAQSFDAPSLPDASTLILSCTPEEAFEIGRKRSPALDAWRARGGSLHLRIDLAALDLSQASLVHTLHRCRDGARSFAPPSDASFSWGVSLPASPPELRELLQVMQGEGWLLWQPVEALLPGMRALNSSVAGSVVLVGERDAQSLSEGPSPLHWLELDALHLPSARLIRSTGSLFA